MSGMFAPDPVTIVQQDAAEWKRRALAAEGKLDCFRRLREAGEQIAKATFEKDRDSKNQAFDNLVEELACLDVVVPPRDVFNQRCEDGGVDLTVRTKAGLGGGACSTLDLNLRVIEIESLTTTEGKTIGLFFQLFQLADILTAMHRQVEQELTLDHLHVLVPAFLALATKLNLLHPDIQITAESLESYVVLLKRDAARAEAASVKE